MLLNIPIFFSYISENEESETPLRKMADGAEIAREEEDFSIDK